MEATPTPELPPFRRVLVASLSMLSLVGTLLFSGCNDLVMTARYATATEARADGAVQRGWVPDQLPDSAVEIRESHDLDSNTGLGSFTFGPADDASFRAQLLPATAADLTRYAHLERDREPGYEVYTVPGFIIAVHWQKRHVRFTLRREEKR